MVIEYTGGFIGLEELAARLKSIVPWDMRGNVVLAEDFETELTDWYDASRLGGSATSRTTRHKYSGNWSLKLYNGGVVGAEAYLYRYFHFPGLTKYAAFARFCWDDSGRRVVLYLELRSGTQEFEILAAYDLPTTTLHVMTTGGAYHDLTVDLDLGEAVYTWYPLMVTFDLRTRLYNRLYFADKEYDISSIAIPYASAGADPRGMIEVGATYGDAVPFTAYVDDVVLAKNVS